MIDVLLTSISEFISLQKDYANGQVEEKLVNDSMKRFAGALTEYIDYRIKAAFEERRKVISQEKISLAEELNTTVKETAQSIHSIQALNSAPAPPSDPLDQSAMEQWSKDYHKWYFEKRTRGMSIK